MHQDYQKYDHENVVIRGQWIRHGNQRNWDIINLVFLLEYNGVKILHGGDAEGLPEFFAPFNFQEANIDVALLPFWYLLDGDGKNLVEKYISPDKVIGIHVPRVFNTYMEKIKTHFPDDVIFTKTGQVLEIEINK